MIWIWCSCTVTPLILIGGQFPVLSVSIMCTHLETLTFILHFCSQFSNLLTSDWILCDATGESLCTLKNAVSSAKVDMWVSTLVGISAVNNKYRNGYGLLPWGISKYQKIFLSRFPFSSLLTRTWRQYRSAMKQFENPSFRVQIYMIKINTSMGCNPH